MQLRVASYTVQGAAFLASRVLRQCQLCQFTLLLLLFLVQSQKRAVAPARAARRASVSVVARASSAAKQSAKNSATGLTVLARCGSSHNHSFTKTTTVSSKHDAAAACSRIMLCSTASSAAPRRPCMPPLSCFSLQQAPVLSARMTP
jgi:hypothetical protein